MLGCGRDAEQATPYFRIHFGKKKKRLYGDEGKKVKKKSVDGKNLASLSNTTVTLKSRPTSRDKKTPPYDPVEKWQTLADPVRRGEPITCSAQGSEAKPRSHLHRLGASHALPTTTRTLNGISADCNISSVCRNIALGVRGDNLIPKIP